MAKSTGLVAVVAAAFLCISVSARAAHISIDDSDPDTMTLTAVDFEGGLLVDGLPYLGGPLVLTDDLHTITGTWIDLGVNAPGAGVSVLYAMPAQPDGVTSGITFSVATDGFLATLDGGFGGFTGAPYFFTADPTIDQTSGLTAAGAAAFLTLEFTPELRGVPEPASLALVATGLALAARRRPRRAEGVSK